MAKKKQDDREYSPDWGGNRKEGYEETKVMRIPKSLEKDVKNLIDEYKESKKKDRAND